MYFDSWSTSYFFWVIICFAVWGMAGFSVYGAINVFASRRNKYKKRETLTPEKIQELKRKAEQGAKFFAQKEAKHKEFEKEKKATVKSVEDFVNSNEKIKAEKEEISELERELLKKAEVRDEKLGSEGESRRAPEQTEIDHSKLKEIYEKELKIAEAINSAESKIKTGTSDSQKKAVKKNEIAEETSLKDDFIIEKKASPPGEKIWKELDDVFRTAFRR